MLQSLLATILEPVRKQKANMSLKGVRENAKANSWYTGNPEKLSTELEGWLDEVPDVVEGRDVPIPKARVIIAP